MIKLCQLDSLKENQAVTFELENDSGNKEEIFVIRYKNGIFSYLNSCPHTGAPLNWLPNQFLNQDNTLIQCANHDALFDIERGICLAGPCAGEHLTPVTIRVHNQQVILDKGGSLI